MRGKGPAELRKALSKGILQLTGKAPMSEQTEATIFLWLGLIAKMLGLLGMGGIIAALSDYKFRDFVMVFPLSVIAGIVLAFVRESLRRLMRLFTARGGGQSPIISLAPMPRVRLGAVTLRVASALLPAGASGRYSEEWRDELHDIRQEGARWYRRAGYVADILIFSVPRLAVTLRLAGNRAVE